MLEQTESGFFIPQPKVLGGRLLVNTSTSTDGNMAFPYGTPEEVLENRTGFTQKVGVNLADAVWMRPVHGVKYEFVTHEDKGKGAFKPDDAIFGVDTLLVKKAEGRGVVLAANPADCPVVCAVNNNAEIAGIAHSGLEGTNLQVTTEMFKPLFMERHNPSDFFVAVTPGICAKCFQMPTLDTINPWSWQGYIQTDTAQDFDIEYATKKSGERVTKDNLPLYRIFPKNRDELLKVDMNGMIGKELAALGVPKDQIEYSGICTYEEALKGTMYSNYLSSRNTDKYKEERYTTLARLG